VAAESDTIEVVLVAVRPEPETTVFTTKTVFAPGRIAPNSPVRFAVHLVAGVAVKPTAISSETGAEAVLPVPGTSA
jgi:hypothetical protein